MSLPAHLARYHSLIELLVDEVVRELIQAGLTPETALPEPSFAARERITSTGLALPTRAERAA